MVCQNQKEKNDTVVFASNKDDSENKRSVAGLPLFLKNLFLGDLGDFRRFF